MAATAQSPSPTTTASAPSSMAAFRSCRQTEIRLIIMKSHSKSCSLDPVPTFLVHEVIDLLLPYGDGQRLTAPRPTADFSEARCRYAVAQEAGPRHSRHGKFPTSLQFDVHVEGRRTCRVCPAERISHGQRSSAALPVSLQEATFNRNCDAEGLV